MSLGVAAAAGFFVAASVSAQDSWVLFPPSDMQQDRRSGPEYIQELLGAYGDTFHVAETGAGDDPDAARQACVRRAMGAVSQLGYGLQGLDYQLTLEISGDFPPLSGTSCRVTVSNDLEITIETQEAQ